MPFHPKKKITLYIYIFRGGFFVVVVEGGGGGGGGAHNSAGQHGGVRVEFCFYLDTHRRGKTDKG